MKKQNALERYYQREIDKNKRESRSVKRKPNSRPEKAVEKECVSWMRGAGWQVEIYEAKAVWNQRAGCYTGAGLKFGTADCMGVTDQGIAVAVEFKAPGKLSTFLKEQNYKQREFITDRIRANAFSCVTDSLERLKRIYEEWKYQRSFSLELAKSFLFKELPVGRATGADERLFD